jgi:hypothetical protein
MLCCGAGNDKSNKQINKEIESERRQVRNHIKILLLGEFDLFFCFSFALCVVSLPLSSQIVHVSTAHILASVPFRARCDFSCSLTFFFRFFAVFLCARDAVFSDGKRRRWRIRKINSSEAVEDHSHERLL